MTGKASTVSEERTSKADQGFQYLEALIKDMREGASLIEKGMRKLYGPEDDMEGDEDGEEWVDLDALSRRSRRMVGSGHAASKRSTKVAERTIVHRSGRNGNLTVREHVLAILGTGAALSTRQLAEAIIDRGYQTRQPLRKFTTAVSNALRIQRNNGAVKYADGLWMMVR